MAILFLVWPFFDGGQKAAIPFFLCPFEKNPIAHQIMIYLVNLMGGENATLIITKFSPKHFHTQLKNCRKIWGTQLKSCYKIWGKQKKFLSDLGYAQNLFSDLGKPQNFLSDLGYAQNLCSDLG